MIIVRTNTLLPTIDTRQTKKATRNPPTTLPADVAERMRNAREISALHARAEELTLAIHEQKMDRKNAIIAELQKRIAALEAENTTLKKSHTIIRAELTAYQYSNHSKQPERGQSTLPGLFNQGSIDKKQGAPTPAPTPKRWNSF